VAISFAVRTVVLLAAISPFVSVPVSFLQIVVFCFVLFICVFGGWTLWQVVFLFALFLLSPRAAEWRRRQNIATIKAKPKEHSLRIGMCYLRNFLPPFVHK
jgi:hypothetical protein